MPAARISSPVLVGRDAPMRNLLATVTAPPAVTVVEGEAGVGKTRLVTELLAREELRSWNRLVGRCHPVREPFPLGPVVDALRGVSVARRAGRLSPVAGALRPLLPELADMLPAAFDPPADPRDARHLLFRGVLELLGHLGPTVCVLEDLHWADETTADFLRFAVAQMPRSLALVATFRREDLAEASPLRALIARLAPGVAEARIELSPLPVEDVRMLAATILGDDEVSAAFAQDLHVRTGGVPFAVEEMLRSLPEHPDLVCGGRPTPGAALDDLAVPRAVRDAVLERTARLSRDARAMVDAAAVAGDAAPEEVLAAAAELTDREAAAALSEAMRTVVLLETDAERYGFRHTLAQQAVYENIPRPERRRLHTRVAEALRSRSPVPVAQVAHHYRMGGRTAEWVQFAEAAADVATSVQDHRAAARFLHDALQEPGLGAPARARMAIKLARSTLSSTAPPEAAAATLGTVVEDGALPVALRGEVRSYLGLLIDQAGNASEGHRQQALAVAELGDRPDLAARIMLNLASPWVEEGTEAEHRAWLQRAADLAQQHDDGSLALGVRVARALILLYVGDPAGWAALRDIPWRSTSTLRRRELLWGAANLMGACYFLGHYEKARSFLDDAVRRARDVGWAQLLHTAEAGELMLDWATGRWDGLEERARRHAQSVMDRPGWAVHSRLVLGSLSLARGEGDDAESWLRSCAEAARAAGHIPALAMASAGLGRLHLERGDAEGALRETSTGLDVLAAKGIWVWSAELTPVHVEALLRAERAADAEDLNARFAAGIRGRDGLLAAASLELCRGLVHDSGGRHHDAAERYAAAEVAYTKLPRGYDAAHVAARRGACLLAAGDAEGGDVLSGALASFERLDARADVARLRRMLRRHSIAVPHPWRGGRRGYGNDLSPRESEVAELAARGRTDAEIAQALFISPRTVAHHLASALHKLEVRSRRTLVERRQAGLDLSGLPHGTSGSTGTSR